MNGAPRRLGAIAGIVPSLIGDVDHCVFASRCSHAQPVCHRARPPVQGDAARHYSCILTPAEVEALPPAQPTEVVLPAVAADPTPLIAARGLNRSFSRKTLFGRPETLQALADVSLELRRGETFAVVGESGSGKSTLARILLGLDRPDSGQVLLEGEDVTVMDPVRRARLMQPIFQDPYSSLNPRHTIAQIIGRPLLIHDIGDAASRRREVAAVMEKVGLPERVMHNYPSQMSGGQRQRVAIARALVMNPALLVCDEPTSALDVSVQAQILNLLADLQRDLGLTYLLITHNIGVVHQVASRIAVMQKGRIVETGEARKVLHAPEHPYTKLLLSSVPELDAPTATAAAAAALPLNGPSC